MLTLAVTLVFYRLTVPEHKQVGLTGNGVVIAGRKLVFERWTEMWPVLETGDSWTVIYEIWSVVTWQSTLICSDTTYEHWRSKVHKGHAQTQLYFVNDKSVFSSLQVINHSNTTQYYWCSLSLTLHKHSCINWNVSSVWQYACYLRQILIFH